MRGNAPAHQFRRAKSLDEALTLLSEAPGLWTPLAGGTDLMVYLESGTLAPGRFLDLWALEVLRGIRVESDTVRIGALSTYRDVRDNAHLAAELPNLCDAARLSGAIAIQNRGTSRRGKEEQNC